MTQPSLDEMLADAQQVKRFAKFLHASIPLREALQLDKRVNYFRGKKLIEVLLDGKPAKNKPVCNNEEDAKKVGLALLRHGLIHASEVADKKKKELRPIRAIDRFEADGFFTWIYEGSKTMRNIMLAVLVFAITAMCLFPVWPQKAKVGIWYVSVTLLIFLFVLFTVRLVLYLLFWSMGFEFWILPNFFDDDLGVADSFRPVYSFEKGNDLADSWYFRAALLVMIGAFGVWCSQQPTEFDELYAQQMDFLSELYDGKLLSDKPDADDPTASIGVVPDLEELQKQIEEDEIDPEEALEDEALDAILEADEAAAKAQEEVADDAQAQGDEEQEEDDGMMDI